MAGLIPDDYSALTAVGSGIQGFAKGLMAAEEAGDRRADREMKRLEFEAKMKADQTSQQKKTAEDDFKKSKDQFDKAGKLRDDWLKNQTTKDSQTIRSAYDKIKSTTPTPAGDMSMAFAYMKMLDPGSTVREGEQAQVRDATSLLGQVQNAYNKALTGQGLSPEQRRNFVSEASKLYQAQQNSQRQFDESFGGLADTYQIPREEVVLKIFEDPQTGEKKLVQVPAAQSSQPAPQGGLMAEPQGLMKKGLVAKPPASDVEAKKARLEELRRKAAGG